MNRLPNILPGIAAISLFVSGCALNKNKNSLEEALQTQDAWLKKQVDKSKRRSASFDQKWDNYSKRQDEKYHAWLDKVMDD